MDCATRTLNEAVRLRGDVRSVMGSDIDRIFVTFLTFHAEMSPNVQECEPPADSIGRTDHPAIRWRCASMGPLLDPRVMAKGCLELYYMSARM